MVRESIFDATWKEMGGQIHPLPPEDLARMSDLLKSVERRT